MSVIKSMSSLRPRLKCLPSLRTLYCCRIKLSQNFSTEPPPTEEPPVEYVPKPQLPGKQSLYNPDYLEILKPNIPKYPTLNIKLKGNDYAVLERLQSIIHKYLLHMGVTVTESFAKRAESFKVVRFAPNSAKPMTEYILKEYERVIQIDELPGSKLGTILEIVQAVLPGGVTCSIKENTEEEIKSRYIPDRELVALQQQLVELGGPSQQAKQRELDAKFRR